MRFYKTYKDALNEITRDLAELSIEVKTTTYQDKVIENDPDFFTKEAQSYIYTVTSPDLKDLEPTQPWADAEFEERVNPTNNINPGEAWKLRRDVWEQFLEHDGKFAYTYHDRMKWSLWNVIDELMKRPTSRQLFIPVFEADDARLFGDRRVPCSLGYQVQFRQNKLNLTYLQRSSDYFTHFVNDIYLARKLQEFIADSAGMEPGIFVHWIASLHVFSRDVAHVF